MKLASVTNSERLTAACPQRWLLRYGLGLRGQETTPALYIGTLVHAAIEQLSKSDCSLWTRHASNIAINIAADDWRKSTEQSRNMMLSDDELQSAHECEESAKRIMEGYIAKWRFADWKVVLNEYAFDYKLRDENGRALPSGAAGKIDRVVVINGEYWLVETKTTSVSISEWVERNKRNPQALSYALALQISKGIKVRGVIYDLVNSKPGKMSDQLAVLKDRSRLAKPSGLPYCTSRQFEIAIADVHGTLQDGLLAVDWYSETLRALYDRDQSGFWFHREVLCFTDQEIDRVFLEIKTSVKRIAKWRKMIRKFRNEYRFARIREGAMLISEQGEMIHVLQSMQGECTREPSMCFQYNRLCSFASICASHSEDDLQPFTVSKAVGGHDELHSAEIDSAFDQ